jgi:hypothetical protein
MQLCEHEVDAWWIKVGKNDGYIVATSIPRRLTVADLLNSSRQWKESLRRGEVATARCLCGCSSRARTACSGGRTWLASPGISLCNTSRLTYGDTGGHAWIWEGTLLQSPACIVRCLSFWPTNAYSMYSSLWPPYFLGGLDMECVSVTNLERRRRPFLSPPQGRAG